MDAKELASHFFWITLSQSGNGKTRGACAGHSPLLQGLANLGVQFNLKFKILCSTLKHQVRSLHAISQHCVVCSNQMTCDAICLHRLTGPYGGFLRLLLVSAYHVHCGIPERGEYCRHIRAHGPVGSHHSDSFDLHIIIWFLWF